VTNIQDQLQNVNVLSSDLLATPEEVKRRLPLTAAAGDTVYRSRAAVRAILPDLRARKGESAVLVTNGGLGYFDPKVDKIAVDWNSMGLAMANAAKHKLVGMLSQKLAGEGIYVGEVVVLSLVKGTAFDGGSATLEPSHIAAKFWDLYRARKDASVDIA